MSDICLGNKHVSDIDKVDIECIPYYKKIVNLITMCVDPIYVDLEAENDNWYPRHHSSVCTGIQRSWSRAADIYEWIPYEMQQTGTDTI